MTTKMATAKTKWEVALAGAVKDKSKQLAKVKGLEAKVKGLEDRLKGAGGTGPGAQGGAQGGEHGGCVAKDKYDSDMRMANMTILNGSMEEYKLKRRIWELEEDIAARRGTLGGLREDPYGGLHERCVNKAKYDEEVSLHTQRVDLEISGLERASY